MRPVLSLPFAFACALAAPASALLGATPADAPLPPGVRPVWDMAKAWRETTPTRERICANGLWRFQPAEPDAERVPEGNWGFFKVPGPWPGISDYMQKDFQTLHAHPSWKGVRPADLVAAWYQREIAIPRGWAGRRILLAAEVVNSLAIAYLDGERAGTILFPGAEAELTALCRPGERHLLSILVVALPIESILRPSVDPAAAREEKGRVARRGLCGDVWLASTPPGARIRDARVRTSVRRGEIAVEVGLDGLAEGPSYALRAKVTDGGRPVKEFGSPLFRAGDLRDCRIELVESWRPERLWDIHTPQNQYELEVSLLAEGGSILDLSYPVRFGFRELWIDGRDFFLDGTRIFLSAVPLDNAQVGAALATYDAARETLRRLRRFGINFVYTHNYGCEPGSHLSFSEILRAADDVGVLVALSQPHFSHYDWRAADADETNGYARHAAFYVAVAGSHPSVVFYSMSHNATGYAEDMNPDRIDGISEGRDPWSLANAKRALRAEAIVRRLDPSRIVYHHASGNLGSMHTTNFYPNFVPIQELRDWFEEWTTRGVKPAFTCEYGAPFSWDWAMYRGWYRGERSFGSARVPWEFCLAEWNAQFLGDRAYRVSEEEKRNLRWEASQFRARKLWHRWDYPHPLGSNDFDERDPIFARYLSEAWRAFRTWGVSATSPWEHHILYRLRAGVDRSRRDLPVDWEAIHRPGPSPDFIAERYERMDLAYEIDDWIPTAAAEALIRNNGPLLAYLAGKPAAFTSGDHNILAGETIDKQIIVIDNARSPVECRWEWSLDLPAPAAGRGRVRIETGEQARIPLRLPIPPETPPGAYRLAMRAVFDSGERQEDSFEIHVLPAPPPLYAAGRIALFDPKGETADLLRGIGVPFERVDAGAALSPSALLVIGKGALTVAGSAPDLAPVRQGLRVIVFEQASEPLQARLGFRVQEYGLREVFPRLPDHPALAGLRAEHLRQWRGEATLLAPRLAYETSARYAGSPAVRWCGLEVPRLWRCGNRGNVASVLIEKPARGDFLPIVDGGFSLQYAPLMEYREGEGLVVFCQMDVTGRTERDPAADRLARNLIAYASSWRPAPRRRVLYAGEPAGRTHLEAMGLPPGEYPSGSAREEVLVIGPGGGRSLPGGAEALRAWLEAGGRALAVGIDEEDARACLPFPPAMRRAEHIACFFEPPPIDSPLAGVGPADVHNRDPRPMGLVASGAEVVGDGVLAVAGDFRVVLSAMAPWHFAYREGEYNLKRTFRRASFLFARILANLGAAGRTPILERFADPPRAAGGEARWLEGLYLDSPEAWDDPYRFFRW